RRGWRRVGGVCAATRSSRFRVVGCRLSVVRSALHHHHHAWIGALESEGGRFLLHRAERGQMIELELQRLVVVLDLLALILKIGGLVTQADHFEVLPGEEEQEQTDGDANRQDGEELAKALAVAFTNDVSILDGLLLRVHSGADRTRQTRVK